MSLCVTSLNSGSNANSYYVGTRRYGILVDAGLGIKQTKFRMKELGLDMENIRAIFISHEHIDHVRGLPALVSTYNVPVFASRNTWDAHACLKFIPHTNRNYFSCGDEVQVEDISVRCFFKKHDGVDPHSFVVERNGTRVGIFTDIGEPCNKLTERFKTCHAAILEANYDDDMLLNGRYPYYLKKRISGSHGHLSNKQALEIFLQCRSKHLKLLMLGHLSKENNRPDLVHQLFAPHTKGIHLAVASRYTYSPLFAVAANNAQKADGLLCRQLSLF